MKKINLSITKLSHFKCSDWSFSAKYGFNVVNTYAQKSYKNFKKNIDDAKNLRIRHFEKYGNHPYENNY